MCISAGHGFFPGGASPAGDPRPAASLLHQPGCPAAPSSQELRHEERRPGQVRQPKKKNHLIFYQFKISRVEC